MEIALGIVSILAGLVGVWLGHALASGQAEKYQKRQELWQELTYWRGVFEQHIVEVQKIARLEYAANAVFGDKEITLAPMTPAEQYHVRSARQARLRAEAVARELGIDAGISADVLHVESRPPSFN